MQIITSRRKVRPATRVLSRRLLLVGACASVFVESRRGPVHAQAPSGVPRVGILWIGTPTLETHRGIAAFRRGLRELGYTEGRSIDLEYRGADGKAERLDALANELVHAKVAVILAGATSPALAAKRVVSRIPIVFCAVSGDPVNSGLVASLARPGGNATGTVLLGSDLDSKRLELLVQALPAPPRVALLRIPGSARHDEGARDVEDAARRMKIEIVRVEARGPDDIEQAMREARRRGANALLALGAPEYSAMRARLAEAA